MNDHNGIGSAGQALAMPSLPEDWDLRVEDAHRDRNHLRAKVSIGYRPKGGKTLLLHTDAIYLDQDSARIRVIRKAAEAGLRHQLACPREELHECLIYQHAVQERILAERGQRAHDYMIGAQGLVRVIEDAGGRHLDPLTNFIARIIADVEIDDGTETQRNFEIEAVVRDRTIRVTVPAAEYTKMEWVLQRLGASAVIYAGVGTRDHVRTAIQELSGDIPHRVAYAHTGWRCIGDQWVYLHAGGGIGADGQCGDVQVAQDNLGLYRLPVPPDGHALRDAVRASLALLNVAAWRLTVPTFRASGFRFPSNFGGEVPVRMTGTGRRRADRGPPVAPG